MTRPNEDTSTGQQAAGRAARPSAPPEPTQPPPGAAAAVASPGPREDAAFAAQMRGRRQRLRVAVAAALLLGFAVGNVCFGLASLVPGNRPPLPPAELVRQQVAASRQEHLREYLLDELVEWPSWWRASAERAARAQSVAAGGAGQPLSGRGRPQRAAPSAPRTALLDRADAAYESLYGSSTRYASAARSPLPHGGRPAVPGGSDNGRGRVRGVMLQARLLNDLAGSSGNAPAVAALTQQGVLGKVRLPAGTQFHGEVRGSNNGGNRLLVDFHFARKEDGSVLPLLASAADRNGREGIPGKRQMGAAAAGSVGLAAVSRAGEAAGRSMAGGLGAILGAGMEGATASSVGKGARLDTDDDVLLVARGARLLIYVRDFDPEGLTGPPGE